MKRFLAVIFVCLSAILTGCETLPEREPNSEQQRVLRTDQETASLLVGIWYGKYDREPGELVEHITTHNPDGTFTVKFRTTESDGSVIEHSEKGLWRVRGDILSKSTKEVEKYGILPFLETSDTFYNDEYKIISLSQNTFQYEHIRLGILFTTTRVSDDFSLSPLKLPVKAREPSATPQTQPTVFSDEARSYIESVGRTFIDRFDQVCSVTKLELSSIESEVESLGWNIGQTRPSEKNIRRWTSFAPFAENQNDQSVPIFILDVALSIPSESGVVSCALTMWGTSSNPDIGKQEIELIARNILSPKYQIGDIIQQTQEMGSPFSSENIQYTTYGAELTKSGENDLRYLYRWFGGTHSLVATIEFEED